MADITPDSFQEAFLIGAAVLVLFKAWHGWRLGVVRQIVELIALGAGYACGWFLGPQFAPLFRPLGFPDAVLVVISAVLTGVAVFLAITLVSSVLFKRTEHQSFGLIRFGYGASGALIGAAMGIFFVWLVMVTIRVGGTIAETKVKGLETAHALKRTVEQPDPLLRSFAGMKHSLEQGTAGAVMEHLDPVPESVYSTLTKLGTKIEIKNMNTISGVRRASPASACRPFPAP
jgi:hypothetical protein